MSPADTLPLVRAVTPLLHTRQFGQVMEGYASLDSTNTRATNWAAEGAREGSVVVAEHQTAGRGRYGRSWEAASHQNLMFSIVLRPELPAAHTGLVTIAAAVAVAEVLDAFVAPLRTAIKWPNDVLVRERKCCGMLLEASVSGRQDEPPEFIVLGIGLNVNQDQFPSSLAEHAISLKQAVGQPIERPPLLAALLEQLEQQYRTLFSDGGTAAHTAYEAHLQHLGQPVTLRVTSTGQRINGTVQGISDTGALRLETKDGLQTFHAGEVTSQC